MSWKGGGRSVRDEAEARACIAAMQAEGTTVYGYAVAHGVSASSLYRWRNRLGIETSEAEPIGRRTAPAPAAFVPDVPRDPARPGLRSPADEDEARFLLEAFAAEGGDLAAFCRARGLSTEARDMTPEVRLALRRERSAPIVADLRRWLDRHLGTRLPKEPLTKALNYLHNHWDALFRFLHDGRIPIDNNLAERQLKAIALGRKAYLCAGSTKAAKRAALFCTFVRTCMQHDVDPLAWLTDVLPRIATARPSRYGDLLPMNWKQASAEAIAA